MSKALAQETYDADRMSRNPLRFLREIPGYPGLAIRYRALVKNFFVRDLLGRFRGSMLGIIWVLIHPIFLFLTYYLVFGLMFGARGREDLGSMWYPLYLFSGVLCWTAFAETASRCTTVIVENGNLIKKVAFPAQLLPLHLAAVSLLVYFVGIVTFFLVAGTSSVMGVYAFTFPGWNLLLLPVGLLVQMVFTLGMGLLLACSHVFFRDVAQIFPILANLWFFASPVFWHEWMFLDARGENRLRPIMPLLEANPLHPILVANRATLGIPSADGSFVSFGEILGMIGTASVPAALCFAVGFVLFRSLQHRFPDEV